MKLILHIGTTKTGSSSTQDFFTKNRALLLKQGVLYPTCLAPKKNHTGITVFAAPYGRIKDLAKKHGIKNAAAHERFCAKLPDQLRAEIAAQAGVHTVVISNEHLHSRIRDAEDITRLKNLLAPMFSSIEVICYLRPQLEHAIALHSTLTKHKRYEGLESFLIRKSETPDAPYFNFETMLKLWRDGFGLAALNVRLFEDVKPLEHGVLSDLCDVLGFGAFQDDLIFPPRSNISVSAAGLSVLLARNETIAGLDGFDRAGARAILQLSQKHLAGPAALPKRAVAEHFHETFAASNTWVRDTWFQGQEILEPNWAKYDAPPDPDQPDPEQVVTPFVQGLIEQLLRK